jgi:hypothetical protein
VQTARKSTKSVFASSRYAGVFEFLIAIPSTREIVTADESNAIAKLHVLVSQCMEKSAFFLLRKWASHIMKKVR